MVVVLEDKKSKFASSQYQDRPCAPLETRRDYVVGRTSIRSWFLRSDISDFLSWSCRWKLLSVISVLSRCSEIGALLDAPG